MPHGPANYATGGEIQHDREIQSALARPAIREIADPHAIERGHRVHGEVPIEDSWRDRMPVLRVGGDANAWWRCRAQARPTHQPRDPMHAGRLPLREALRVHPQTAIRAMAGLVDQPLPTRIIPPIYPGHFEVHRVSTAGTFRLHNGQQCFTQALNGEMIGLEEVQDGLWNVIYYETLLGRFDERSRTITGAPSLKKDC